MSEDIHRKVNPRAKLKTQPDEIQSRLFAVVEESTLDEALEYVREELKIDVGRSALAEWAAWYRRRQWISEAESDAAEMEDMLKRSGLQLTPDAIAAISNAVFLNRASKMGDAKTFVQVAGVIQRSQELKSSQAAHEDKMQLANRKVELQAARLENENKKLQMQIAEFEKERATASDIAADTALTDEEKVARWKQVFGR